MDETGRPQLVKLTRAMLVSMWSRRPLEMREIEECEETKEMDLDEFLGKREEREEAIVHRRRAPRVVVQEKLFLGRMCP